MAGDIGLAEVIAQVRKDLQKAQREGTAAGAELRFEAEKVTLEVAIQVRREGSGGAGLRIGVVTADLGGSVSKETVHRVQVELKPQHASGRFELGGYADGDAP
jgi:hypothetical protein